MRGLAASGGRFSLTKELNAVNILLRRMNASALLIKAIGGGWEVASLPQY